MLKSLHIRNFALIAEAKIEFTPGFNLFSGETGAGKSILIDALGIVLGNRASAEYIREGEDSFWVQAVFEITDSAETNRLLSDFGIAVDEDFLFMSRKFLKTGKSMNAINGVQVPLNLIQQLAEQLIDIHGQHENQRLLKTGEPLNLVDTYGFCEVSPAKAEYRELFTEYVEARKELALLQAKNADSERLKDSLQWEIQEIKEAHVIVGEEEQLQGKIRKLANNSRILAGTTAAYDLLNGGEDGMPGVLTELSNARAKIVGVKAYDEELEAYCSIFESALISLEEARRELGSYIEKDSFDPNALTALQERQDLLYRLKKKYGPGLADVLFYLEKAETQLEELEHLEEDISKATKKLDVLLGRLEEKADILTKIRCKFAEKLSDYVTCHVRDLAMPESVFSIKLMSKDEYAFEGRDEAQIYFKANPGQELRPLAKVASGGELSRIALAVKTVLLEKSAVPTMVFDEVDTGVGGVTAERMAEKIAIISQMKQVLCVTHLAQIASFADNHLYIEKVVQKNRTATLIKKLDEDGRIEEIMRMAGGSSMTEASRLNAVQLIASADDIKAKLESGKDWLRLNEDKQTLF